MRVGSTSCDTEQCSHGSAHLTTFSSPGHACLPQLLGLLFPQELRFKHSWAQYGARQVELFLDNLRGAAAKFFVGESCHETQDVGFGAESLKEGTSSKCAPASHSGVLGGLRAVPEVERIANSSFAASHRAGRLGSAIRGSSSRAGPSRKASRSRGPRGGDAGSLWLATASSMSFSAAAKFGTSAGGGDGSRGLRRAARGQQVLRRAQPSMRARSHSAHSRSVARQENRTQIGRDGPHQRQHVQHARARHAGEPAHPGMSSPRVSAMDGVMSSSPGAADILRRARRAGAGFFARAPAPTRGTRVALET